MIFLVKIEFRDKNHGKLREHCEFKTVWKQIEIRWHRLTKCISILVTKISIEKFNSISSFETMDLTFDALVVV